jgi:hypothetical protein
MAAPKTQNGCYSQEWSAERAEVGKKAKLDFYRKGAFAIKLEIRAETLKYNTKPGPAAYMTLQRILVTRFH